tara:strand:- start:171 stop:383 length:213 start_codon:yes stop_codon:yes gene_type:complete
MKSKEINKLSIDEMKNKINLSKKDLFNFRFRKVNGQLEDTAKISQIKKDVAKLFTALNKKNSHDKKNIKR